MRKINIGWGLMALPWMVVALCVGVAACSRSQPTETVAPQVSTPTPTLASAPKTPVTPAQDLPQPVAEALAYEAREQDQEDLDNEFKTPPDDSYIHAPLRPSYVACVKESRGMTDYLQRCGNEEYAHHEAKFRTAVAKIMDSPDSVEKDRIMDDLAAWWEQTNKHCAWDPQTEGQGQMLDAQSCQLNRVANHAVELEAIASQISNP